MFHTIREPLFRTSDFLWGFVDFLNAETLAYLGLLAIFGFALWKINCWVKNAEREQIRAFVAREIGDQERTEARDRDVHRSMKSVVNLTEHRRNTKGAA